MKDIHDVITQAKFGDYRLRGSGVVAGQISAFPIDFAGRPYNTLTLPRERVIQRGVYLKHTSSRDTTASSALGFLTIRPLMRYTNPRTHSLSNAAI